MSAERRRAHRLPVQLRAHYRSAALSAPVEVIDLSRHGIRVRCDAGLDHEGTRVAVVLDLLEGPVSLAGEVVRLEARDPKPCVGIRFTGLDEQVRRDLANYMIERHYLAHA